MKAGRQQKLFVKRFTVEGFRVIEWGVQRPQLEMAGRNRKAEVKFGTKSGVEGRRSKGLGYQAGKRISRV